MIKIKGYNRAQNIRVISDIMEPYVVKQIQKKNHTLFVYRCSSYKDIDHFLRKHRFRILKKTYSLLKKYWSSIDILYIKPTNMPKYEKIKEYFDKLYELDLSNKLILDFEIYEVKLISQKSSLPKIMSVKSYHLSKELILFDKNINVVEIYSKGNLLLDYNIVHFKRELYNIKTHYGRKNYTKVPL